MCEACSISHRSHAGAGCQSSARTPRPARIEPKPSHEARMHALFGRGLLLAGLAAAVQLASASFAYAQDAADIAEGARLFRQKGNCQSCHGWAGDGRKMDSQMPDGANLRES